MSGTGMLCAVADFADACREFGCRFELYVRGRLVTVVLYGAGAAGVDKVQIVEALPRRAVMCLEVDVKFRPRWLWGPAKLWGWLRGRVWREQPVCLPLSLEQMVVAEAQNIFWLGHTQTRVALAPRSMTSQRRAFGAAVPVRCSDTSSSAVVVAMVWKTFVRHGMSIVVYDALAQMRRRCVRSGYIAREACNRLLKAADEAPFVFLDSVEMKHQDYGLAEGVIKWWQPEDEEGGGE